MTLTPVTKAPPAVTIVTASLVFAQISLQVFDQDFQFRKPRVLSPLHSLCTKERSGLSTIGLRRCKISRTVQLVIFLQLLWLIMCFHTLSVSVNPKDNVIMSLNCMN